MRLLALLCLLPVLAYAQIDAPEGEASKPIGMEAPTSNVDGSSLTDLALLRVYSGQELGEWSMIAEVPYTDEGGTHTEQTTVTVMGDYGDVVTVFYTATAVDERGNESDFATAISEDFLIVDNTVPLPPRVFFEVPVARKCRTPDGESCGLIPVS